MAETTSYSDLHYVQTDLSVGGIYKFTSALYATAEGVWQRFRDKDPYVYGDQDGNSWRGSFGVGYRF